MPESGFAACPSRRSLRTRHADSALVWRGRLLELDLDPVGGGVAAGAIGRERLEHECQAAQAGGHRAGVRPEALGVMGIVELSLVR